MLMNRSRQTEQDSSIAGTAEEVRDFYDRYPYPRPTNSLEEYQRLWQDRQRRRADYHLFWPARPFRGDFSILVAGCGTSQAAKHAIRWPEAQVTGIDFSATSVRCTEDLRRRYNLGNLQIHKLPIERVKDLGTSFDQIVCTGVLHHLPDPDAGLRALRGVLNPDGAMHLMVYAPYGRTGIYMLQAFCRQVGIHATDDDIRDLITALGVLPPGHPLEDLLRETPDFRQEAALADALLHPQDRAYSVPQLLKFIVRGGLTFGRWIRQAPYSPHCGVMAHIPQASRMARLSPAEQYAAVELFRGTMVRHSVVVYRDDNPSAKVQRNVEHFSALLHRHIRQWGRTSYRQTAYSGGGVQNDRTWKDALSFCTSCPQPISFEGEAWLGYVPIRTPDTICVQERLPPGAAGVLINRTHTYRDLFKPIDAEEKCLFDAIDGNGSIGDIVGRTSSSSQTEMQSSVARSFFESLWWHDQVVFDASQQPDGNALPAERNR